MSQVIRIKCGTGNCYLVADGKNAVLVDTGSKENISDVIAVCDKYDIKLILLTHTHFDHAENAAELSRRYSVPVALHRADDELFDDYSKQPLMSRGMVGKVILTVSLTKLGSIKVKRPDNMIFVKEGDDLKKYGIDARIVEIPGHTIGSIGLDVEERDLIVGDALDNWVCPEKAHLYFNSDAVEKSAEKIRSLGERMVWFGHGNPVRSGEIRVQSPIIGTKTL
ncbi:Glyoxylase, beta-lactamase superfamily II [Oscillospiraceae bacterium]|nr:Glyoxylase, beta-lactamase superfamily II [Oscillospiraceae bacterium]